MVLLRYSSAIAAAAPCQSLSNDVFGEMGRDESETPIVDPFRLNIIAAPLLNEGIVAPPPYMFCSAFPTYLTHPGPYRPQTRDTAAQ